MAGLQSKFQNLNAKVNQMWTTGGRMDRQTDRQTSSILKLELLSNPAKNNNKQSAFWMNPVIHWFTLNDIEKRSGKLSGWTSRLKGKLKYPSDFNIIHLSMCKLTLPYHFHVCHQAGLDVIFDEVDPIFLCHGTLLGPYHVQIMGDNSQYVGVTRLADPVALEPTVNGCCGLAVSYRYRHSGK